MALVEPLCALRNIVQNSDARGGVRYHSRRFSRVGADVADAAPAVDVQPVDPLQIKVRLGAFAGGLGSMACVRRLAVRDLQAPLRRVPCDLPEDVGLFTPWHCDSSLRRRCCLLAGRTGVRILSVGIRQILFI